MQHDLVISENAEVWYEDYHALHEISMGVKKGEVIGLIGPNGCGKSTLLRAINGILKTHSGTIYVDGKNTAGTSLPEMAKVCANVPTEFPPDFNLKVSEVVMMGRYPHRKGMWETLEDEEVVENALHLFEIDHLKNRNISNLSSGERQRTLIAKAYVQQPKIMLVDEPTSHLDIRYSLEVMEYFRGLVKQDTDMAVIIACHDLNLATKYCDRLVMVKEGRIVATGTPEEIITAENIAQVYNVRAKIIMEDGVLVTIPLESLSTKIYASQNNSPIKQSVLKSEVSADEAKQEKC